MLLNPFKSYGVLGINARNLLYIRPFNPKKSVAFADDKLKTKLFLSARNIPAAKIYGRIDSRDDLYDFRFSSLPDECVLKPNLGYGGEGIVILKRKNGRFTRRGKQAMSDQDLFEHIEDILDGKYSLGGRKDSAFFEQILKAHDCFAPFRPAGLPDLRIIVFNLVPIMAMLRIPTLESDGKANVHLGGVGIGVDIARGTTTHAVQYNDIIDELPHGGSPKGIPIPYWDDILLICSQIQQITNIGYLAVDITIDQDMGPALLEVNARAGLMLQIANLAPLRNRLERVKGVNVSSPEKGVRIGQELFGDKLERNEKKVVNQTILGTHEMVSIAGDGESIDIEALIEPTQERTTISTKLAAALRKKKAIELISKEEKRYRLKLTLAGQKIQTSVGLHRPRKDNAQMLVGTRDLAGFLIDPSRTSTRKPSQKTSVSSDARAMDRQLGQIDRDLMLLKHLKPNNLPAVRNALRKNPELNPTLTYPELDIDLSDVKRRLQNLKIDDSALGQLFEKKRQELLLRTKLLEVRATDADAFTAYSKQLFGAPTSALVRAARSILDKRTYCCLPEPKKHLLNAEEARKLFVESLELYGLHDWEVLIRSRLVANCTVGGTSIYIKASGMFSRSHIRALIAHEIETHVLCAENGNHQPYDLFRRGFANYLDTQEGLATYNQNTHLNPGDERRYNAPRNTLGLRFALRHSLAETRHFLETELGYNPEKAISQALTFKRGCGDTRQAGAFTKSIVYLRGLRAIEQFVKNKGDLRRLYLGRISLEDLDLIEQIPGVQQPLLLPMWLRSM